MNRTWHCNQTTSLYKNSLLSVHEKFGGTSFLNHCLNSFQQQKVAVLVIHDLPIQLSIFTYYPLILSYTLTNASLNSLIIYYCQTMLFTETVAVHKQTDAQLQQHCLEKSFKI